MQDEQAASQCVSAQFLLLHLLQGTDFLQHPCHCLVMGCWTDTGEKQGSISVAFSSLAPFFPEAPGSPLGPCGLWLGDNCFTRALVSIDLDISKPSAFLRV